MSQQEVLKQVVEALDASQTPYMLTGSLVSSFQGEPRSTHDVDFVVLLGRDSSARLFAALSRIGGYLDRESIERAIESQSMFNLIEPELGIKVDFWMLTDEAFDRSPGRREREARHRRREGIRGAVPEPGSAVPGSLG